MWQRFGEQILFYTLSFLILSQLSQSCPGADELLSYIAAVKNQTTELNLDKRWFSVQEPSTLLWPNKVVPYCIDSSVTQHGADPNRINEVIQKAWGRWVSSGVDSSVINFRLGSTSECQDRGNSLFVTIADDSIIAASLGRKAISSTSAGPSLKLTLRSLEDQDKYLVDPQAHVAHELGHVLGLVHEHQRPELWKRGEWPDGTGTDDTFIFTCQNILTYDDFKGKFTQAQVDAACKSIGAARLDLPGGQKYTFLSTEFLPVPNVPGVMTYASPGLGTPLDLDSIMLYPSYAQGKIITLDPLVRESVYILANEPDEDDAQIFWSGIPSKTDTDRVNAMYRGIVNSPGSLYFQTSSPHQQDFTQMRQGEGSC